MLPLDQDLGDKEIVPSPSHESSNKNILNSRLTRSKPVFWETCWNKIINIKLLVPTTQYTLHTIQIQDSNSSLQQTNIQCNLQVL